MSTIFAQEAQLLKAQDEFNELMEAVRAASAARRRIDDVESELWSGMRQICRSLLEGFVEGSGTGDLGPTLEHKDRTLRRLEQTHNRRYVSVFGELTIARTVYGSRETQKHEVVPLDALLGLPDSEFSYLLQDWVQGFCVEGSFASSRNTIERILDLTLSVRSLEHMNASMSEVVEPFRQTLRPPPRNEEGSILVVTVDGKGVPMRRQDRSGRAKGPGPDRTREACVGAVYSIDPFIRTADDLIDDVFRQQRSQERPKPCHKRLVAELTRPQHGQEVKGKERTFRWLAGEVADRRARGQPVVCVMDGDAGLWGMKKRRLRSAVGILDIYHVLQRLWKAAHCFHPEGSPAARNFVEQRLRRILDGEVGRVIGGLKQMAVKHQLHGNRLKELRTVIGYLHNNRRCMKYDEYLAAGYPIGSGVVEGACRHLVKDRMEQTGMHWRISGAQAMLSLRGVWLNDHWETFHRHRKRTEQRALYPYRRTVLQQWRHAA